MKGKHSKKDERQPESAEKNQHHIVPASRCTCGVHSEPNKVLICKIRHDRYHQLFGNMTPQEIVRHLVGYYWDGQWNCVENALDDHYARVSTQKVRSHEEDSSVE